MTLNELIRQLQELADGGHGDYQMLAVHQPNYPLQENDIGVWFDEEDDEDEGEDSDEKDEKKFIYIVVDGVSWGVSSQCRVGRRNRPLGWRIINASGG